MAKVGDHRILNGGITEVASGVRRQQCDSRASSINFLTRLMSRNMSGGTQFIDTQAVGRTPCSL